MRIQEPIRNAVNVFDLLIAPLFFALYFLVSGQVWGGSMDGMAYRIVIALITIGVFFFYTQSLFKRHLSRKETFVWIILVCGMLSFALNGSSEELARSHFSRYLCFSVPSALIGVEYSRRKDIRNIAAPLQLVMLLLTFGFGSLQLLAKIHSERLALYQTISYSLGFAYATNLLLLLFRFDGGTCWVGLWKLMNFKYSKVFYAILLLLQVLLCLISGGRGGFVLIVASTIGILYFYSRLKTNKTKLMPYILFMLCLLPVFSLLPPDIKEFIEQGCMRVFSYLTPSGIDMSQTSHRDVVYEESLELIAQRPWFGYGIWAYFNKTSGYYPHNIFLEFLMQRGIPFLAFMLWVLFRIARKYFIMVKTEYEHLLVLPLILLPGIKLLFSETYLEEGLFWFSLVYIYTYRLTDMGITRTPPANGSNRHNLSTQPTVPGRILPR